MLLAQGKLLLAQGKLLLAQGNFRYVGNRTLGLSAGKTYAHLSDFFYSFSVGQRFPTVKAHLFIFVLNSYVIKLISSFATVS